MAVMDPGANRPFRFTGGINFDVPGVDPLTDAVDFASGGAGRGSMPFGDYPIMDYVAHTPKYGLEGFALNNPYGRMPDPKYPGGRSDIMLHLDAKGRTLDKLKSNGCLSVVASEWPALRDQIISLQKQGYKLVAHLDPDGNVTIRQADATSGEAVSTKDFISSTNEVRQDTSETQTALAKAGFDPGPIDGISGPQTKEAVKAFQESNGLAVDGIVGPETRAALAGTASDAINSVSPGPDGSSSALAYGGNMPAPLSAGPRAAAPTEAQVPAFMQPANPVQPVAQQAYQPGMEGRAGPPDGTFEPGSGEQPPIPLQRPPDLLETLKARAEAPTVRATDTGQTYRVGQVVETSNGRKAVVSNDGTGKAKFTIVQPIGAIPGVTRGIDEPPGTIVGNYVAGIKEQVGGAIGDKAAEAVQNIGQMFAGDGRPSTAQTDMAPMSPPQGDPVINAAADLTKKAGGFFDNLFTGSGLKSMFGGTATEAAPEVAKNASGSPDDRGQPDLVEVLKARAEAKQIVPALNKTADQIGQEADNARLSGYRSVQEAGPAALVDAVKPKAKINASGGPDDRGAAVTAPAKTLGPYPYGTDLSPTLQSAIATSPTRIKADPSTTYKVVDMEVSNPDYVKFINAQKADAVGAGPGSFGDLQAMIAGSPTVAPAKTITVQKRVPVVAPTPMPGRPAGIDAAVGPDPVQQMFLGTPIGKALNALNGGTLGTYRVPRVSPEVHQQLMAQQSSDQRGQAALRASGMLDQFGMII